MTSEVKSYRVAAWYWWSVSRQRRVCWPVGSVQKALRWRKNKYWKYAEFQSLEEFISTVPDNKREKERKEWIRHRDGFRDLELHRAYVLFPKRGLRSDDG